jgi:hypothetical protein
MITWIVPTVSGREALLEKALVYPAARDDVEVLTYLDRPTCGEAWAEGAAVASGDYIYFAADDIEAQPGFIEESIETIDEGYLPAATVLEADGTLQSCGGIGTGVCAADCPDWAIAEWSPTPFIKADWWTDHLAPHADMIASLHYSSDVLVSYLLKRAGIVPAVRRTASIIHHNALPGRGAGMTQNERTHRDYVAFYAYMEQVLR